MKRRNNSKTRKTRRPIQTKAQPTPNRRKCNCPLVVEIPGVNGLTNEEIRYPERFHQLWHKVTTTDAAYFSKNQTAGWYEREYVENEAWPRQDIPINSTVRVIQMSANHHARAFLFNKKARAA